MGKIKKTLASLVLAGASVLGLGGKANSAPIFYDGFENWDSGYSNPVNGWVESGKSPYVLTSSQDRIYVGNKSLLLEGTSGGNGPFASVTKSIPDLSGNIRFEWYSRASTLPSNGCINGGDLFGFVLQLKDYREGSGSGYWGSFGIKPVDSDDRTATTIMEFNEKGSYDEMRYQIDVDTNAHTISYNLRSMASGVETTLTKPYFDTPTSFTLNGGQHTDLYGNTGQGIFDEVSISTIPEPCTLASTLIGGIGLTALKKRRGPSQKKH